MEEPDFWNDPEESTKIVKELKNLKDTIETYQKLESSYEDIEVLLEMAYEEEDASLIPEIEDSINKLQKKLEDVRISTLLSGKYDKENAILTLHAGAGGTESCDWASMLYRMFTRWAENKGFSCTVLDYLDGDEAGIKSVTIQINGLNAYGYLKSEKGSYSNAILVIILSVTGTAPFSILLISPSDTRTD